MGNSSSRNRDTSKNDTHYEGHGGACGTTEDVFRAGAAASRLEDYDSPGPIGDAIMSIVDGINEDINWAVAPSEITGSHSAEDCPNK